MSSHNLHYRISKGWKALLYDTSLQLQRTDFTEEKGALAAHNRLHTVLSFFESYRIWEANYILPPITFYEPGLAAQVEEQRREQFIAFNRIESLLHEFSFVSNTDRQLEIGRELVYCFEGFSSTFILQLAQEEKWVNKLLGRYYSNKELQTIEWKFISAINTTFRSPDFYYWVIQGLTPGETENWLQEVKWIAEENEIKMLEAIMDNGKPQVHCEAFLPVPDVGIGV